MNTNFENGTIPLGKRQWHEEDSSWKAEKIYQIINNNNINLKTLCEIGCGEGGVLYNLASYFDKDVKFSGYETVQEEFEVCKKWESENVKFFQQDLLKTNEYFDVVMAINVFTHVRDYLGFLSKLRQKGEYKVFYIPLQVTIYSILRSRYMQNKEFIRSHLHHFNKDTALGTLKGTGYQIIDYSYTSRYLDYPNREFRENLWKLLFAINKDFAAKLLGGFWIMVLAK